MDQLKLFSELKLLEGMLLQHQILLRWTRENLEAMGPEESDRVSKLLKTASTVLRGQIEEAKAAGSQ